MATILFSAIGAAVGASVGGGILGLSSVVIGRAIGATIGRSIDESIMGNGSDPVEHGRVDRLRLVGASEGAPIAQVYGRMRLAGQVIWATRFEEVTETSGGGKGFSSSPKVTEYSYKVSIAIALCEGVITRVGRVWADGVEIAPEDINMRVYTGTEDQMPDPKIEAVNGAGLAPAYRGIAYVVLEDMDVTRFGNRVPQLNFEVFRPEQPDEVAEIARGTQAVAMIPGSGEYALATTPVFINKAPGVSSATNTNSPSGKTDFLTSLDMLSDELPNCGATSLVVSWFGDDLRCGNCTIAPKVEQNQDDGDGMPWSVSGISRGTAALVASEAGRPVYGGTPTDQSVKEAITALKDAGKAVTFYPFILMDQLADNTLPNPYDGGLPGQPALPWRGRITLSLAPGQAGSPDQSAGADAEVAAFFGLAAPTDFNVTANGVSYSGPAEFSYRRMILHYAHLCASVGGVDAFLIGSELRGLTQIRGAGGTFPAVAALIQLAADVRSILGPEVKISYAADWTEYSGFQPPEAGGDLLYNLDPLWGDANIDFVGIDNYMPLSDWREGVDHKDAQDWDSIYNLGYLMSNIMGGEGYDWYYHAPEAEAIQLRTDITDGAYGEPWVWRYKDIRNWWTRTHHERVAGVRNETPTAWEPGSKPIWFTELGCAAIDKGTNQPNKFLDPKSSESSLPKYSNGRRDDFIQMQYLRAMFAYWGDPANNPTDVETGVQMLDMSRAHVWAWDARPYPFFPGNTELWSDGVNYTHGHWLNGRASSRSLGSIVREVCARSGVTDVDVSQLYGLVRGYSVAEISGGRNVLQPLMLAYGIEAAEREGQLVFTSRHGRAARVLDPERLALTGDEDGSLTLSRAPAADIMGRIRLSFVESEGDYETRATEAIFPGEESRAVSQSEFPLVLTQGEGRAIVERWLAESRVARDTARFSLPLSDLGNLAGEVVEIETENGRESYRLDRVENAGYLGIEAVRVEPGVYEPSDVVELAVRPRPFVPAVPVYPVFMDLPLLTGDEVPHAPHLAVTAEPWPGSVAAYASPEDSGYSLNTLLPGRSIIGVTESPLYAASPALFDNGAPLRVRLSAGTLDSVTPTDILNGANAAVIGDGSVGNWEVFQFAEANLIEPGVYDLSLRLRGQAGSDALMPAEWPIGSTFVLLDKAPRQIDLALSSRGLSRHYRVGPAQRPYDDPVYSHEEHAFDGIGLRPYAPVHLEASRDGSGDLNLTWIRRTRIDGDSWQSVEVPLGEDIESYLIRVMDGPAVIREETVPVPAWTYAAADQAADGLAAPFSVLVAQVSASFGPGLFRRLEVTS
ncbi:MAG TPA: host specificity protein [Aliiroseovarius sp.]|nr:host specificity protein [Aliiroseovarius sp.]